MKVALEEGQRDQCSRDSLGSFVAKIIEVGMRESGSSDRTTRTQHGVHSRGKNWSHSPAGPKGPEKPWGAEEDV